MFIDLFNRFFWGTYFLKSLTLFKALKDENCEPALERKENYQVDKDIYNFTCII